MSNIRDPKFCGSRTRTGNDEELWESWYMEEVGSFHGTWESKDQMGALRVNQAAR